MKKYTDYQSMVRDGLIRPEMLEKWPNCIKIMKTRLVEYIPGEHLTLVSPVLKMFLNPSGSMQGGFIGAAFDNAFGLLIFLTTRERNIPTVDLNVNFHRPILGNDELFIKATIKHLGKTIVQAAGEGFNKDNQLIATAYGKFIRLGSLI